MNMAEQPWLPVSQDQCKRRCVRSNDRTGCEITRHERKHGPLTELCRRAANHKRNRMIAYQQKPHDGG